MLQRIVEHYVGKGGPTDEEIANDLNDELTLKFVDRGIDNISIRQLIQTLYPRIPGDVSIVDSGNFTLRTLEDIVSTCGLDISSKAIKKRSPPGDKSWKDPQRQLYDEIVCSIFVLKAYYSKMNLRYSAIEEFIADYPELEMGYRDTAHYIAADEKKKKELDKIASAGDLTNELFICNTMFLVSKLYANHKKVFKTRCIYLVADIVGDCRGHMGRDPSSNTLRLILFFERLTEIKKRPARPLKSSPDDTSMSGDEDHDHAGEQEDNEGHDGSASGSGSERAFDDSGEAGGGGALNKKRKYTKQNKSGLGIRASTGSFLPFMGHLPAPAPAPDARIKRSKSTSEHVNALSTATIATTKTGHQLSGSGAMIDGARGRQAISTMPLCSYSLALPVTDESTSSGLDLLSSVVLGDLRHIRSTASMSSQRDDDNDNDNGYGNNDIDSDESSRDPSTKICTSSDAVPSESFTDYSEPLAGIFPELLESSLPFSEALSKQTGKIERKEDLEPTLVLERVAKVVEDCENLCSKSREFCPPGDQPSVIRGELRRLARTVEVVSRLLFNSLDSGSVTGNPDKEIATMMNISAHPDEIDSLAVRASTLRGSKESQENLLRGTASLHVSDDFRGLRDSLSPSPNLDSSLTTKESSLESRSPVSRDGSASPRVRFGASASAIASSCGAVKTEEKPTMSSMIRSQVYSLDEVFSSLSNRIRFYAAAQKASCSSESLDKMQHPSTEAGSPLARASARAQRLMERFATNDVKEIEACFRDLREVARLAVKAHLAILQLRRCN